MKLEYIQTLEETRKTREENRAEWISRSITKINGSL